MEAVRVHIQRSNLFLRQAMDPLMTAWPDAEQLAEKLTNAGLELDEAREWVNEVIRDRCETAWFNGHCQGSSDHAQLVLDAGGDELIDAMLLTRAQRDRGNPYKLK